MVFLTLATCQKQPENTSSQNSTLRRIGCICQLGILIATYRLVSGEWCVPSHEEVEARCGDERGNQANEVVVHVAWVPQCGRARRHDGGNLDA